MPDFCIKQPLSLPFFIVANNKCDSGLKPPLPTKNIFSNTGKVNLLPFPGTNNI